MSSIKANESRRSTRPEADSPPHDRLGIEAVARLTGVGEHTLRAWERRYGVPCPDRSEGGFRRYSRRDLRVIERVRDLVAAGVAPARAARQAMADTAGEEDDAAGSRRLLVAALASADEVAAARLLTEARRRLSPVELVDLLVDPALREIGALWMRGAIGVETEHIASNLVARHLVAAALVRVPARGPRVLLGCAPGERHDLCLLSLTVRCQAAGWRVTSLGQDVPVEAWLAAARRLRPAVLGMSVSTTERTAAAQRAGRDLRRDLPGVPVFLGGQGLRGAAIPPGVGDEAAFWELLHRRRPAPARAR